MSHSLIGFVQSGEVFVFLSRNYAHSTDGIFIAKIVTLGHGEFFFLEYIIFGWEDYYLSSCNYHHTRQLIDSLFLFFLDGHALSFFPEAVSLENLIFNFLILWEVR